MGNPASRPRAAGRPTAAVRAVWEAVMLEEVDHRLVRLTWGEIGLAAEGPTPLDPAGGRRRNRFAALRPEITAGHPRLRRATRVRALTYLRQAVRKLRADLTATGRLTVSQLTQVCRVFGGDPDALGDRLVALASPSGQEASAMIAALAIEEDRLARGLQVVRRAPDPVPAITPGQLRQLSIPQALRLWAAVRREEAKRRRLLVREAMTPPLGGTPDYETNPP